MVNIQAGVPLGLTAAALDFQRIVEEKGLSDFFMYVSEQGSPYGAIWMQGNQNKIMGGIRTLVTELAKGSGMTEREVMEKILSIKSPVVEAGFQ